MRRPLLSVALLYASGVWFGDLQPASWVAALTLAFVVLPFCLLPQSLPGRIALGMLLVLAGWTNVALHVAIVSPRDLRILTRADPEMVTLRGRLRSAPALRGEGSGEGDQRSLAILDSSAINRDDVWMPAYGRVVIGTRGSPGPLFFQGRTVEVSGVLRAPQGAAAEGLFDYQRHLSRRGIHRELDVPSPNQWATADPEGAVPEVPLAVRFRCWAQAVLARGLPAQDKSLRLTWAMVLGWRSSLTDEVAVPFRRSGTMHVFAISGLHVGMIAYILVSLCQVMRISRGICAWIVIPLLWFYAAVTGWQSSAVRATIMMSILVAGWSLRRPGDLLNSLAGAALVILLWDPLQLFQAGFQLSFCVVLSIALLIPPMERLRERLLRHDPLLPENLRPWWRRQIDRPSRYLLGTIGISMAAWIGSLPWMAWHFNIVTPVALPANLLVVPLAGCVIASSLASLICGAWCLTLSETFNHSTWLWMTLMSWVCERAASMPGGWFHVPAPPWCVMALYYPTLALVASGWLLQRWRMALACVVIAAGTLIFGFVERAQHPEVRLTVLSLRGGDSLYADQPGLTDDLLIDTGDEGSAEFTVQPFLRGRGMNRLPNLLLTHGDVRHVGGASRILDETSVGAVITSPVRFRSPAYRELVRRLDGNQVEWQRVVRGGQVAGWEVLHPAAEDRFSRADDSVMVLRGTFHGVRVLLCSDLGRHGQRALAERETGLRADIVVAGMPGIDEPLGDMFLDLVDPAIIVVSAGEYPASERPTRQLRERLSARGVPVLFTCDTGAVTLSIRDSGWSVRTMNRGGVPGQFNVARVRRGI
jgi:competence protein ComEC